MASNSEFVLVQESGWRGGLSNLMRAGFGQWFRTNLWWGQALLWTAIINGIIAAVLWNAEAGVSEIEVITLYCVFSGLFTTIAAVIIMQDALVGEKETGTAAWVLSKPVSRPAFVLSRLFPNLAGALVTMLLIPGLVFYVQLVLKGVAPNPLNFLLGIGVLWVDLAFFMALTLMLGAFFEQRAPVIGIPLALAFGQQMLFNLAPFMLRILPWTLAVHVGDGDSIASAVMLGRQPPDWLPLIVTLIAIPAFTALALWRFEREEL